MKKNTLAFLIGGAIIVSIAFFLITTSNNLSLITGKITDNSQVALNFSEETSILVTNSINFGAGRVNSNASSAVLNSELGYSKLYFGNETYGKAVFHEGLGVFVFYGSKFNESTGKTWIFNTSSNSWTYLSTANSPTATRGFSMAYGSNQIILFGGMKNDSITSLPLNQTWKFNSSLKWEQLTTTNSPPATFLPAMAFDSDKNVWILFEGAYYSSGFNYLAETWEYNASSNTWTNRTSETQPPGREFATMVYDSANKKIVLAGGVYGISNSVTYPTQVWDFNGTWSNSNYGSISGEFKGSSAVYDKRNNRIIFIGSAYNRRVLSPFCEAITGDVNYDGKVNSADETLVNYWTQNSGDSHCGNFDNDLSITSADTTLIHGVVIGSEGNILYNTSQIYNGTSWSSQISNIDQPKMTSLAYNSVINKSYLFMGTGLFGTTAYSRNIAIYNETEPFNGYANGNWVFEKSYFDIENDGTVNISVEYSADKDASEFIGGTSPSFMIKGVNSTETNSCVGLNESYAEVLTSEKNICPLLKFQQDTDLIKVPVKLIIPSNAPAGQKNSTITFSATTI